MLMRHYSSALMRRVWLSQKKKLPAKLHRYRIVKGDLVEVCKGPHKGRQGVVLCVIRATNEIFVENVNTRNVAVKQSDGKETEVPTEDPIPYKSVQLVHPQTGKPTKINILYLKPPGRENEDVPQRELIKVRVTKGDNQLIPKPPKQSGKNRPADSKSHPKDTNPEVVAQVQFTPEAMSFGDAILKALNAPPDIPVIPPLRPLKGKERQMFKRDVASGAYQNRINKIKAERSAIQERIAKDIMKSAGEKEAAVQQQ
eukprot:Opistho-2@17152